MKRKERERGRERARRNTYIDTDMRAFLDIGIGIYIYIYTGFCSLSFSESSSFAGSSGLLIQVSLINRCEGGVGYRDAALVRKPDGVFSLSLLSAEVALRLRESACEGSEMYSNEKRTNHKSMPPCKQIKIDDRGHGSCSFPRRGERNASASAGGAIVSNLLSVY